MKLIDNETLKKIQSLVLGLSLTLEGHSSGNRKSKSKGSSVEFSDYREYIPGDDFRRVDWNAYGRFERLYIKLFMEEREAPVKLFLDTSKSMAFGEPDKDTAARRLAAALSYLCLCSYDRITLLPWNEQITKVYGPYRTQPAFMEIVSLLEALTLEGKSNFSGSLRNIDWPEGRGISIIITDGLMDQTLEDSFKYLKYKKQEIYLCHIMSSQELKPSLNGALELVDSETGEKMEVTVTPLLYEYYDRELKMFLSQLNEQCRKWGVHYSLFSSEMPLEQMIKQLLA